jgi:hypothetical protein
VAAAQAEQNPHELRLSDARRRRAAAVEAAEAAAAAAARDEADAATYAELDKHLGRRGVQV